MPLFNEKNKYGDLIVKFIINPIKLKDNIKENDINEFKTFFNKLVIQ